MFTNLIESSSHAQDFKRRGSFVLFTTVTYFLLFAIAGVASIYAYDARLEDQNLEEIVMLSVVDLPAPQIAVAHNAPPRPNDNNRAVAVRENPTASVNHPELVPAATSAKPNTNPPVPDGRPWVVGPGNSDPATISGPSSVGNGVAQGTGGQVAGIEVGTPPPLPPIEKPKPQIIHKSSLLNGEALSLPKPPYPAIARQLGIQGAVNVQVVISETGKVISAKAVSGNPALTAAAQQAALQARFSPTILGDQPVKVSGIITYNFVMQ
ncbi:MAG: periplasmic protein TonB [Pyrinomonadaceae bacterium]|jgi:protein TonB|nr:periplasmic protein TonB [Pyrinomonadaceae bacterium]